MLTLPVAFHHLVCGKLGSGCRRARSPASPLEPVMGCPLVGGPLVGSTRFVLRLVGGSA